MHLKETAYAKINLALHVRRRREDGYHELETLFAFVDGGDELVAHRCEADRLEVIGEFAGTLADPLNNIVARALTALPHPDGLSVTLEKNLPVAAGLGGGSADAGAIFRIIREAYGLPDDWRERATTLGADVPACVDSTTHIGRGVGEQREEVENDLAGMACLLVNPRVPLSTGPVFKAWDGMDLGALPTGTAREVAQAGRNDLRNPAISICPQIAKVLARLDETSPWRAEMSGSGATCFALYESAGERDAAAQMLAKLEPDWWQMVGCLR